MRRSGPHSAFPALVLSVAGMSGTASADVLYSNLQGNVVGTQTGSYTVSNVGSGPQVLGQYYNTGYDSITLSSLSFYGGISPTGNANASAGALSGGAGLEIYFFDAAGTFIQQSINGNTLFTGSQGNVGPGVGLKTFTNLNLTLPGAGFITFTPYAASFQDVSTGVYLPPPTAPCTFTGYYGAAPTTGETDPTLVATGDPYHEAVTNIPSVIAAPAYMQLQMLGTGSGDSYYPTATPLWNAAGSGNWGDATNWRSGVPNAAGATANFVESVTAASTVTLASAETVGIVNFDSPNSYTLAGPGTLTLSNGSGPAVINSWQGSHTITAPLAYGSGLTVTAFPDPSPATPSLTLPLNVTAAGALTKLGAGTLAFAAPSAAGVTTLSLPALNISAGKVSLQTSLTPGSRTLLTSAGLSIAGGATLDLGGNDLDVSGSTLQAVNALVASGFNGGTWTGPGIASAAAAADARHLTAIGVTQNNQGGAPLYTATHPFDGFTPGPSDVLAKYTYYGDANLDGTINAADYSRVDVGFVSHLTGWFNGDFNYDGIVDGSDYALMDNAFNQQGSALALAVVAGPSASSAAAVASVPEPTAVGLLTFGATSLVGGRRRRVSNGRTKKGTAPTRGHTPKRDSHIFWRSPL